VPWAVDIVIERRSCGPGQWHCPHQRWRDRRVCGQPAAVRSSTLRVASWSRASPENSGLSPAGAPLQRLVLLRSGHNELGW